VLILAAWISAPGGRIMSYRVRRIEDFKDHEDRAPAGGFQFVHRPQCRLGRLLANAPLKASLDQADTPVVANSAAAVRSDVGLLVAHNRKRKAVSFFWDLAWMQACQCDMAGTAVRRSM